MGWGNESFFAESRSHDQDGRHANIKSIQKSYSPEPVGRFSCTYYWGLEPIIVCSNDDTWMTLTYFRPRSNLFA